MVVLLWICYIVGLLSVLVIVWGFVHFEEWEIGIELVPKDFNNFELGVSNRNYELTDGGLEQELRIGLLLFTVLFLFRRFDA
jgi:hypothetical protein